MRTVMTFPLIMIWMRKEDFHYNRQPSPIHIYKSITTTTTSYHNIAPHLTLMSEQSQYNVDIQIPITVRACPGCLEVMLFPW